MRKSRRRYWVRLPSKEIFYGYQAPTFRGLDWMVVTMTEAIRICGKDAVDKVYFQYLETVCYQDLIDA